MTNFDNSGQTASTQNWYANSAFLVPSLLLILFPLNIAATEMTGHHDLKQHSLTNEPAYHRTSSTKVGDSDYMHEWRKKHHFENLQTKTGSFHSYQQSTKENMLCFTSFPSQLFKSKYSNTVSTNEQGKLNMHILFESLLMLFTQNYPK